MRQTAAPRPPVSLPIANVAREADDPDAFVDVLHSGALLDNSRIVFDPGWMTNPSVIPHER